jgi:hypothetical protein
MKALGLGVKSRPVWGTDRLDFSSELSHILPTVLAACPGRGGMVRKVALLPAPFTVHKNLRSHLCGFGCFQHWGFNLSDKFPTEKGCSVFRWIGEALSLPRHIAGFLQVWAGLAPNFLLRMGTCVHDRFRVRVLALRVLSRARVANLIQWDPVLIASFEPCPRTMGGSSLKLLQRTATVAAGWVLLRHPMCNLKLTGSTWKASRYDCTSVLSLGEAA